MPEDKPANKSLDEIVGKASSKSSAAAEVQSNLGGTKKSYSGLTSRPNKQGTIPSGVLKSGKQIVTVAGGDVYLEGAAEKVYQTFDKQRAANIQQALSRIPGLYPKGKEPKMFNGVFNSYDFSALGKVMGYADTSSMDDAISANGTVIPRWNIALSTLLKNPSEAKSYFRVSDDSSTTQQTYRTSSGMAIADVDETYRTIFGANASKEEHNSYVKSLNALELKQRGQVSAQQKEDLIFGLIEKTAKSKTSTVTDSADASSLNAISGGLGSMVKKIRTAYNDNGVSFTNTKLVTQAINALRGPEEASNVLSKIQSQAAQFFPAIGKELADGRSAREVLDPFISLASQVWEVPDSQIQLSDFYDATADATKPLDVPTVKNMLYSSPKYKVTQGYKDTQMNDLQAFIREAGIG